MKKLKEFIYSQPVIRKYMSDVQFKAFVSLTVSFTFNLLYAVWEIICGIYYRSLWFATLGFYYILLMLTRLILLCQTNRQGNTDSAVWRKKYFACGILLLFMNLVLIGIVVLAVTNKQGSHYAGYLIYAVAAYTFYKIGAAIKNLVKYRHPHNPALTISTVISFISAVISMLSLEIALILQFGNDWSFFQTMTILTGSGACAIISAAAVYIIVISRKNHQG